MGVWKLPISPCSGLIYAGFEDFIRDAENSEQYHSKFNWG